MSDKCGKKSKSVDNKQKSILSFFAKKPDALKETPTTAKRPLDENSSNFPVKKPKTPTHSNVADILATPIDHSINGANQWDHPTPLVSLHTDDEPESVHRTKGRVRKIIISDDEDVVMAPAKLASDIIDEDVMIVDEKPLQSLQQRKLTKKSNVSFSGVAEEDKMDCDNAEEEDQNSTSVQKTPKSVDRLKEFRMSSASKTTPLNSFSFVPPPSSTASSFIDTSAKNKARVQKFKEKNNERYSWLVNILDKSKRSPDHPEYDSRTLFIPPSALKAMTDFEKQFWEIKSEHWDTVVFFKKGKFYELYENDADIAQQQFDLKMTDRTNMRMAGVPESSFAHWASQFIAKGYKVAKVDQMENSVGKSIREKGKGAASKKEKVIRRELTSVLTSGTLTDSELLTNEMSTYCMAIKEKIDSGTNLPSYGVCFIDTATSELNLCGFVDDAERTTLETLLVQIRPKELVLEKGNQSQKLTRLLKTTLASPQINYLVPESEYWDAEMTREQILENKYFCKVEEQVEERDEMITDFGTRDLLPSILLKYFDSELLMSSLGGLIFYLKSLLLEKLLSSSKNNIRYYSPLDKKSFDHLVLDGQTMINLEIFENSSGGSEGTLFEILNHCTTSFGKRLFKRWVCHPLRNIADINERFDCVDDLSSVVSVQDELRSGFSKIPDLERIISRIHTGNCKVKDFMSALKAFKQVMIEEVLPMTRNFKSKILVDIFSKMTSNEKILSELEFFSDNIVESDSKDFIHVKEGFDQELDDAISNIENIKEKLEEERIRLGKLLGTKIVYKDLGKEIYQLEISSKVKAPKEWTQMSKTASVGRYWNSTVRELVGEIVEANEMRDIALRSIKGKIYERFDENFNEWLNLITQIAELDCLMGLSVCKQNLSEPVVRPEFVDAEGVFEVENLRHPCILQGISSDFIPNDTKLGDGDANIILLTGPNMGGKSTILRQTCIAVIMAQLGVYVPASKCRMSSFDRIFTRIGANDNILAGQSTFMVELSETSKILKEATKSSLVILDELGRGTSTFDGYAIAYSVLEHLTTHVCCLGLFSTHYQMLTDEFKNNPIVKNMFMSFIADDENREITFLYKLTLGVCSKSYGMVVANLAGVPEEIIDKAEQVAANFESSQALYKRQVSSEGLSLGQLSKFATIIKETANDDLMKQISKCF